MKKPTGKGMMGMMRSLDTTEEADPEELFGLFMRGGKGKGMGMMRSLETTEEDDPEELFGLFMMKPTGKGMGDKEGKMGKRVR